jgi:hypothetical protein
MKAAKFGFLWLSRLFRLLFGMKFYMPYYMDLLDKLKKVRKYPFFQLCRNCTKLIWKPHKILCGLRSHKICVVYITQMYIRIFSVYNFHQYKTVDYCQHYLLGCVKKNTKRLLINVITAAYQKFAASILLTSVKTCLF